MFTGLVEALGRVEDLRAGRLRLKCALEEIKVGDSLAVNGVCLTAVKVEAGLVEFDLSQETLQRSNLKTLRPGDLVNLERALKVGDRLGGHILQGHVDFTAPIVQLTQVGKHWSLVVRIREGYEPYFVEKGSVGIDGISLTINKVEEGLIYINIIPHTYESTNLKLRKAGHLVNVEVDIIGKYVVNYLQRLQGVPLQRKLESFYNIGL